MSRDLIIPIVTACLANADEGLLSEIRGLVFWRERELRTARVLAYSPGDLVRYRLADGKTTREGRVDHLNKFSLSIEVGEGRFRAVPIERVEGLAPPFNPLDPYAPAIKPALRIRGESWVSSATADVTALCGAAGGDHTTCVAPDLCRCPCHAASRRGAMQDGEMGEEKPKIQSP